MTDFDPVAYSHQLEEALGIPPLVRARDKGPFDSDWQIGGHQNPAQWRRKLRGWTGNLALVTGEWLIGIDADIYKPGGEESWESLRDRGFSPYTPTGLTGGGGRHYLYRPQPGLTIPSRAPLPGYPGIDIKGHAGALIVPPSTHYETGRVYEWEFGWGPFDCEPVQLDLAQCEFLGAGSTYEKEEHESRALDERDEKAAWILCEYFGGHSLRRREHTIEITRPGKERGVSAEIGFFGPGVARVWSSNWSGLLADVYELWKLKKMVGIPQLRRFNIRLAEHDVFIAGINLFTRQQFWLWKDMVPAGQFAMAVGAEKVDKTAAAIWIAARATCGELEGNYEGEPVDVAYISAEDDPVRVLGPRAIAAGADMKRIHFLDPEAQRGFDMESLKALGVKLAIFDPMSVFLNLNGSNEHGEIAMRNALDPFSVLAHRCDMSVIAVRHTRKAGGSDNVFDVSLGSRAWTAAARAVLFFAPDRENPDAPGGLVFARGNLSRHNPAHRYRLDSAIVDLDDGGTADVPVFHLTEGGVGITLEEAFGPKEQATARGEAKEFLDEQLPGSIESIRKLADVEGISERTLRRARKELNIESKKIDGEWWWLLPQGGQGGQGGHSEKVGHLGHEIL